jgi:hypothetical protein
MYLLCEVGCLVAGGKCSEHEVMVCASASLIHRRAGWCSVWNYMLRCHSWNGVIAAPVGTEVEAVPCRVVRFCARSS